MSFYVFLRQSQYEWNMNKRLFTSFYGNIIWQKYDSHRTHPGPGGHGKNFDGVQNRTKYEWNILYDLVWRNFASFTPNYALFFPAGCLRQFCSAKRWITQFLLKLEWPGLGDLNPCSQKTLLTATGVKWRRKTRPITAHVSFGKGLIKRGEACIIRRRWRLALIWMSYDTPINCQTCNHMTVICLPPTGHWWILWRRNMEVIWLSYDSRLVGMPPAPPKGGPMGGDPSGGPLGGGTQNMTKILTLYDHNMNIIWP